MPIKSRIVAVVICLVSTVGAADPARKEIGTLSCSVGPGQAAPTPSASPSPPGETRELLCTFKPASGGAEETYVGTLRGTSRDQGPLDKAATVWSVRSAAVFKRTLGLLEQTYSADKETPSGAAPLLIGERRSEIALQSIVENAGLVAGQDKTTPRFVIIALGLKLKSAAG